MPKIHLVCSAVFTDCMILQMFLFHKSLQLSNKCFIDYMREPQIKWSFFFSTCKLFGMSLCNSSKIQSFHKYNKYKITETLKGSTKKKKTWFWLLYHCTIGLASDFLKSAGPKDISGKISLNSGQFWENLTLHKQASMVEGSFWSF